LLRTAVVLFNLGGPDSLEAIEPFLYNLFSDPDIFKLPFGQKLFAKTISSRRAPKVAEQYKLIGGKSPINEWTEKQREMLETKLRKGIPDLDVHVPLINIFFPAVLQFLFNHPGSEIQHGNRNTFLPLLDQT
jgi:ferrochelatase